MARLLGDQNKVGFFYESGTYATASGTSQWPGFVQNNDIDDNRQEIIIRTECDGSRNVNMFADGLNDYAGTLTYYPTHWRQLYFALGSVTSTSGTNSMHVITETNSNVGNPWTSGLKAPFVSFTLEDAKVGPNTNANFIRTLKGCVVNTLSFSWKQGEPITAEVNYIGQQLIMGSGAASALTVDTARPFIWKDIKVNIPSGTVYPVTSGKIMVNNNVEGRHVCNGSAEIDLPVPLNRDYEITLTIDADQTTTGSIYAQYYQGGSEFNMLVDINATTAGSRQLLWSFSGCKMTKSSHPSPVTGFNEETWTITPKSSAATVYEGSPGPLLPYKYGAW